LFIKATRKSPLFLDELRSLTILLPPHSDLPAQLK
jgi:hypothetical protein